MRRHSKLQHAVAILGTVNSLKMIGKKSRVDNIVKAVCPQLHCSDTFVLIVRLIVNGHHARHFMVQYLLDNVRTDLEFVQSGRECAPQVVWRESTLMLCLLIVLANLVARAPTLEIRLHGCLRGDAEDLAPAHAASKREAAVLAVITRPSEHDRTYYLPLG